MATIGSASNNAALTLAATRESKRERMQCHAKPHENHAR